MKQENTLFILTMLFSLCLFSYFVGAAVGKNNAEFDLANLVITKENINEVVPRCEDILWANNFANKVVEIIQEVETEE